MNSCIIPKLIKHEWIARAVWWTVSISVIGDGCGDQLWLQFSATGMVIGDGYSDRWWWSEMVTVIGDGDSDRRGNSDRRRSWWSTMDPVIGDGAIRLWGFGSLCFCFCFCFDRRGAIMISQLDSAFFATFIMTCNILLLVA